MLLRTLLSFVFVSPRIREGQCWQSVSQRGGSGRARVHWFWRGRVPAECMPRPQCAYYAQDCCALRKHRETEYDGGHGKNGEHAAGRPTPYRVHVAHARPVYYNSRANEEAGGWQCESRLARRSGRTTH